MARPKERRGQSREFMAEINKNTRFSAKTAVEAQKKSVKAHYQKVFFNLLLEKALAGMTTDGKSTEAVAIINGWMRRAKEGDPSAIKLMIEVLGQMPAQKVEHINPPTIIDDIRGEE